MFGNNVAQSLLGVLARLPICRSCTIPIAFAVFVLPVFVLIAMHVVGTEQESATQTLIQVTETQNENMARTLSNTYQEPVSYLLAFDIGDAPELLPIAISRSGLEAIVRDAIAGTSVVNLKLYDNNGVTLFSLDADNLGENVSACECFAHARDGKTVSELIRVGDGHHDGDKVVHAKPAGDILSTMIPFTVHSEDLVASDAILEIQSDVSGLLATIDAATRRTEYSIGVPLAILYVMMVFIVFSIQMSRMRTNQRSLMLASKLAETDAANKAKSEFLSLMSHELRTPLNAIIGFSELIEQNERDNEESETGNYARTIHESGHHMLRQIVSILDMTAIELGELDLDGIPVQLVDVAHDAVGNVQSSFDRSLVTLDVHDSRPLPLVHGDPRKLREVVENLLSNAARFTPAGGTVDLVFGTEPGGWVCLAIKDTGVGMTREQIDRARLPFQQDWNGFSREADGAGLGLTIADKIVTQLGGELVIESLKDMGTKIIIRLPEVSDSGISADHDEVPSLMAAE